MALSKELEAAFRTLKQSQELRKAAEPKKVMPQVKKLVAKPVWSEAKAPVTTASQARDLALAKKVVSTTPGALAYGVARGISAPVTATAKLAGYQESPEEAAVRTLAESKRLTSQMDVSKGMGAPQIIQGRSVAPEMIGRVAGSILPFSAAESAVGRVLPSLAGQGIAKTAARGAISGGALQALEEGAQGKRGAELAKSVAIGTALGAGADVGLGYLGKAIRNIRAGARTADVVADIAKNAPETKVSIQQELGLPEGATWADIERQMEAEAKRADLDKQVEQYYQSLEEHVAPPVKEQPKPFTGTEQYGVPSGKTYEQFAYEQEQARLADEYMQLLDEGVSAGEAARRVYPGKPFSGTEQYGIPEGMDYATYQKKLDEEAAVNDYYKALEENPEIPALPKRPERVPSLYPQTPDRMTQRVSDVGIPQGIVPKAPYLAQAPKAPVPPPRIPNMPNVERELFPSVMRQPTPSPKLPEPALKTAYERANAPRQAIAPELNKTTPQGEITPMAAQRMEQEVPDLGIAKRTAPKLAKLEPSTKVAKVMTDPVKSPSIPLKEKAESVYQSLVSTGRPLERIGGKVRDISSVIRKSAGSVDYVLGNKMIDREGNELGKSLVDIVGDVPKQQKEDLFSYAFHKHNIARMAQDKPVFGETVTPEVSAQTLAEIEARNPGIAEKATELNQYINNLMEGWAKKSGLVNDDTLKTLREMYPDYVPTYRDRSELAKSMNGARGAGLNVIKKAEGSSRDLLPLDQQLAEMTNRVIRSSRKNEMYNAMQDMAEAEPDKMARFFKVISKEKQNVEDGIESTLTTFDEPIKKVGDSYVLNFFRDGEKVQAEISKDMYDALRSIGDMTDEQKVAQVIRKYGTNPFKSLITQYNPLFALSNVMRDIPTAFVYSHNGVEWAKNMPVALKEIVSNGQYWKEYQALGGTRSGIFTAEKGVKPLFKGEGNKVKEVAGKTLEGVEWFNNITETLPRFAEYLATVKKGGNTYDNKLLGMMRASEITTDFTRSGRATKFADAFVPYLNPSVQGIDKFFRQVATKPVETAVKAGAVMTAPALILDQINKNNQEYKEISAREKNGFYLVPDGEGKFYRIPKSRETGVVFATMFEWMARRARGEQVTAKEMIDNVKENFTPVSVVDSTLFTPLYKAVKQIKEPESEVRNFAGIPIEPLSLKRYAPGQRYDQYTSEVAKAIGAQFDISPKAIDYLLRSYSGIVGQVLLPKTSQKGRAGIAGTFEAKFKADPVFKSENQNKLYAAIEKAQQEANSLDREKGYTTSEDRKITTEPEKLASALNKVSKELADYRKRQKEIDADKTMDDKRKQEMIRNLQKVMNDKAKEALQKQGLWKE
jgi:hypothetical protein